MRLKSESICLSVDVAHGFHPNYPEKFDPQHLSLLGGGIVLKFNADQKYATSSHSAAPIIQLCKQSKIPYQLSVSRSDIASGSTVGSFMAANLGMPTVDLGICTWSMHSSREVLSTEDQLALGRFLQAAFEHTFAEEA